MTIAGQQMKKKADAGNVEPKGAAKAIIAASNQVVKAAKAPGRAASAHKAKVTARKERDNSIRQAYGVDTKEQRKAGNEVIHDMYKREFADKAKGVANTISGKFKKGNEAMEAYDIYELIMEAYNSLGSADDMSDTEFAAQLEAML